LYSWPLGSVVPTVLCKTCSVLLYVLEQPRVDNSSAGPNWLKASHTYMLDSWTRLRHECTWNSAHAYLTLNNNRYIKQATIKNSVMKHS